MGYKHTLNRVSVRVGGFYSGETDKPAAGAKAAALSPDGVAGCLAVAAGGHHRESLPSVQWRWTVQCRCSQLGGAASPLGLGAWACERSVCPRSKREEQQCGGKWHLQSDSVAGAWGWGGGSCSLQRQSDDARRPGHCFRQYHWCLFDSLSLPPSFVLSSKQGHLSAGRR